MFDGRIVETSLNSYCFYHTKFIDEITQISDQIL